MQIPKIILLKINHVKDFPKDFQTKCHTHLYCHSGNIKFVFNDKKMVCKAEQFLFWFAESNLKELNCSLDFKASILLVEKEFLMNNIPDQSWSINALLHSRVYPIKTNLTKKDKTRILYNFNELNNRFQETEHLFYEEVLKKQMELFILDMWYTFANEYENRKHSTITGTIYEKFIQYVQQHCTEQREVKYYSNLLNITPKYLNYLCKTHSGITASEWIQRYTKEHILVLLQDKNLNISEIALLLNFNSRSFFTRYVKKLLGVTPNEYRSRLSK